jgi:Co/Zn/Cd efflux system component
MYTEIQIAVAVLGGLGNFWVHLMLHKVPEKEQTHTHKVLSAHVLSDAILSLAVVVSASVALLLGWIRADPIFSVGVAGYMLFLSGSLFKEIRNEDPVKH